MTDPSDRSLVVGGLFLAAVLLGLILIIVVA
jgi:hypothetical protein